MTYLANVDRYCSGMEYRRAGTSGILLPEISLGLWHNFGDVDIYSCCRERILYAFDHGITSFDLANNYGPSVGSAEETFGRVVNESLRAYRDELFISTKAGHDMWPGPYGSWGSRKHLIASIDQSLRRMQLDYVDIFYSHRYDPNTPLRETMQALVDIVKQGKALYVGLSKYPYQVAQEAYAYLLEHDTPCLLYQGKYNLVNREPEFKGLIGQAKENGSGFIAFSPLAQGLLTGRYIHGIPADSRIARGGFLKKEALTPDWIRKIQELSLIAERRGQSLAQMSLAWLLKNEEVTSVIVGASSVRQLAENINSITNVSFDTAELQDIENILL